MRKLQVETSSIQPRLFSAVHNLLNVFLVCMDVKVKDSFTIQARNVIVRKIKIFFKIM